MATRRAPVPDKQAVVNPKPAVDADRWSQAIRALDLSPQQAAIVDLILHSKSDKEIAAALGLSKHTVRTYLYRIFARLGVTDRMGVVLAVAATRGAPCTHAECPHKQ